MINALNKWRFRWIALAIFAFVFLGYVAQKCVVAFSCRNQLKVLRWSVVAFQQKQAGKLPLDIFSIDACGPGRLWSTTNQMRLLGTCLGVRKKYYRPNGEMQPGYICMNWEPFFGTNAVPGTYPFAYDRRLSNHGGLGINVVPIIGEAFWDFRAKWLRKFAAEHPEYHMQLPE